MICTPVFRHVQMGFHLLLALGAFALWLAGSRLCCFRQRSAAPALLLLGVSCMLLAIIVPTPLLVGLVLVVLMFASRRHLHPVSE
jgi:hypothetical protein